MEQTKGGYEQAVSFLSFFMDEYFHKEVDQRLKHTESEIRAVLLCPASI